MIDVIIPTRNAPESLWLCLTHFWAYACRDKLVSSVVLLDNCSTDPRVPEILAIAQKMPRHQVIRHDRNVGVWCSVNRGLALSRSGLVLVLTSDVLLGVAVLPLLVEVQQRTRLAFLGPETVIGLGQVPALATQAATPVSLEPGYNGSCWLMDWPRLREAVGWFDPRFYVCFGDTDYVERLRVAAARDPLLEPAVVKGIRTCHLDKQSRRADGDARQDTEVELRDGTRFREKWRDNPQVLARHPGGSRENYLAFKERDLGGWEAAKVR